MPEQPCPEPGSLGLGTGAGTHTRLLFLPQPSVQFPWPSLHRPLLIFLTLIPGITTQGLLAGPEPGSGGLTHISPCPPLTTLGSSEPHPMGELQHAGVAQGPGGCGSWQDTAAHCVGRSGKGRHLGRTLLCPTCDPCPGTHVPCARCQGAHTPGHPGMATSREKRTLPCVCNCGLSGACEHLGDRCPALCCGAPTTWAAWPPACSHLGLPLWFRLWQEGSLQHLSVAAPMSGYTEVPSRARAVSSKGNYKEKGF